MPKWAVLLEGPAEDLKDWEDQLRPGFDPWVEVDRDRPSCTRRGSISLTHLTAWTPAPLGWCECWQGRLRCRSEALGSPPVVWCSTFRMEEGFTPRVSTFE